MTEMGGSSCLPFFIAYAIAYDKVPYLGYGWRSVES